MSTVLRTRTDPGLFVSKSSLLSSTTLLLFCSIIQITIPCIHSLRLRFFPRINSGKGKASDLNRIFGLRFLICFVKVPHRDWHAHLSASLRLWKVRELACAHSRWQMNISQFAENLHPKCTCFILFFKYTWSLHESC